MRRGLFTATSFVTLLIAHSSAQALIYLPENTLESLLVKSDAVAIGTIAAIDESANRGTLQVEDSLKGDVKGTVTLTNVTLPVTTEKRKPRFVKGDRVVIFLAAEKDGSRQVLHSQKLENDAEVRTMKACIAEITPFAATLADLADPKKPVASEPLQKALSALVGSKNAYTQILVGRLMATRLPGAVKPESCEPILTTALASRRTELVKGALTWCGSYEKLPVSLKPVIEKIAKDFDDNATREAAADLLRQKP